MKITLNKLLDIWHQENGNTKEDLEQLNVCRIKDGIWWSKAEPELHKLWYDIEARPRKSIVADKSGDNIMFDTATDWFALPYQTYKLAVWRKELPLRAKFVGNQPNYGAALCIHNTMKKGFYTVIAEND